MPKKMAKKMICNMLMSTNEPKMFFGTKSTKGCNGPELFVFVALVNLSETHSLLSICSALMASTIAARAGSFDRLMLSSF